jgi:hypothetical protein
LVFSAAWVYGWGLIDCGDVSAVEDALSDEIGESEDWDGDTMCSGCDAQEGIGDHRGEELEADGIVVVCEELTDFEMLFDPAEQEFDLPASFVERGDVVGGTLHVVGEKDDGVVGALAFDAQAA